MKIKIGSTVIRTVQGDITKVDFADAIVNSAGNPSEGGSGVNNAIHKAAGPRLAEEYKAHKDFNTGEAIITRAYNLPCKRVIHTKGPIWAAFTHVFGEAGSRMGIDSKRIDANTPVLFGHSCLCGYNSNVKRPRSILQRVLAI